MSFRRVNRSKKVPGVKLRPAQPDARKGARTPESTWTHSSGLDSDDETSVQDLCPRPFKGFVLCATGISDKTSLFKLALELGAQSLSDLTDKVTHLVAEQSGSAKYRCALESRIPIMHPSWIIESHKIWLHGDDVDVPQSIKMHRLPPFAGVVVCVSGIGDVARRLEINQEVTKGGGTYVKQLERPVKVTHLLCGNTSEAESEKVRYAQKFNDMREAQIHIVWEDWFWDSLRFGGRFNEERYLVSNPRPSPRALPEAVTLPPPSSTAPDESGISSEIQNAEASARGKAPVVPAPAPEEEEIASGKRVPAMTLHLWESILKPRGFEVQGGRLVRSPSKSQSAASAQAAANAQRREGSPSRAGPRQLSKRGTMKDLDGDKTERAPISALSKFQRSRSFLPNSQDASTPKNGIRQPFQRTSTMSRTSSFLQRPPGSIEAMAGMASDIPIVSSSYAAGPSRAGSAVPEDALTNGTGISDAARVIFKGYRFRALGEARCASVKSAIEECGGRWISQGDDADVDFIVVRLVSGSNIFRQEADEEERAKYRTECWLERCMFEERLLGPEEHIAYTPLKAEVPIPGAEEILLSFSGLDHAEACTVRRLLRALGISHAPNFSRRSTHLLCPSGEGAKADKAREWSTPIVDMSWLATLANAGEIPSTPPPADDGVLDLPVESQTREPDEWMASQPSAPRSKADPNGKGKEKAAPDVTMHDITNAEEQPYRSPGLSYYDPPPASALAPAPTPDDIAPGQAEQMEVFGMPNMLLEQSAGPENASAPASDSAYDIPVATQTQSAPGSELPLHDESQSQVAIPSKLYEERVPSSESPSPLRLPGHGSSGPATPNLVTRQATTVIQDRIMTLLGKRRSEEEEDAAPGRLHAQESRLGKRSRPLQRTRSNMSYTTPGGRSPASTASPVLFGGNHSAGGSASKKPLHFPDPVDYGEEDNSFLQGPQEDSLHVAYADPKQNGELDRLKFLFQVETGEGVGAGKSAGKGKRNAWDMDLDVEKELTLPQLPDAVAVAESSGKKVVARGRRGKGRRGVRV
ncbi:hypothetical protein C8Q74DRAFT_664413 [Fomes fomentarius]|nr:hypothetical protein C8Q74DRAFT_664413 [Fomes fomentarius]